MSSPSKNNPVQNLYQIPSCTICLNQLDQDLASLACGHCFHLNCISQHFQYRGTCPNCQKRACFKQTRVLHFQPILNDKASAQFRSVIHSLSVSERNQMEHILKQLKIQSESAEKLKKQNNQLEIQLKTKTNHLQNIKEDINRKKNQIQKLRKDYLQLQKQRDDLRKMLNQSESTEAYLRIKLQQLENQLRDYELFKKYKKVMNENSQQLIKLKSEMQSFKTPPEEMAKQFFQLCQISKLEQGKYRQKIKDLQLKVEFHQEQYTILKEYKQKLEREIRKLNEKNQTERKKVQLTGFKCRQLKQKSMDVQDKEDSIALSNTCRKIVKVQAHQKSITSFLNTNIIQQNLENTVVRKPTFAGTSKIGGLNARKKDDIMNFLNIK